MADGSSPAFDLSGSQSVDRALRLLALVGREDDRGLSLSDAVDESGLNKPTVRRLLLALMRAGLVEQDGATRRYFLGESAFVLGVLASRRHGLLEIAVESVRDMCAATLDTGFVSVRQDNYAVCLHREEGAYPVRTHALQAGYRHPLGIGAGSLAILAALPDEEVERVLAANERVIATQYPAFTPDRIRADVDETRRRGHSLNPGLLVAGSWGMGAAVSYPDGRVAGALSVAAIDSRMRPERQPELAAALASAVATIEGKLRRMFRPRISPAAAAAAARGPRGTVNGGV